MDADFKQMFKLFKLLILLMVMCLSVGVGVSVAQTISRADQLKAVFLYKIVKFVQWPPSSRTSFNFCVSDKSGFIDVLNQTVKGKDILGQEIKVIKLSDNEPLAYCHVHYIHDLTGTALKNAIKRSENKPILTIGNAENFNVLGGVIRFTELENRLGFEINNTLASSVGLAISANLLRLSKVK